MQKIRIPNWFQVNSGYFCKVPRTFPSPGSTVVYELVSTSSRTVTEIKQHWAWLVIRWKIHTLTDRVIRGQIGGRLINPCGPKVEDIGLVIVCSAHRWIFHVLIFFGGGGTRIKILTAPAPFSLHLCKVHSTSYLQLAFSPSYFLTFYCSTWIEREWEWSSIAKYSRCAGCAMLRHQSDSLNMVGT